MHSIQIPILVPSAMGNAVNAVLCTELQALHFSTLAASCLRTAAAAAIDAASNRRIAAIEAACDSPFRDSAAPVLLERLKQLLQGITHIILFTILVARWRTPIHHLRCTAEASNTMITSPRLRLK